MSSPVVLPLDWLHPTLDTCRRIVERGVHEIRRKAPVDGNQQIVTDVDLEVEQALVRSIRSQIPAAVIISEETVHDLPNLDESDICFVIDPIDGTEELVAGRPGFSVSVAEYRRGLPFAAVLDFPRLTLRFESGAGQGTWQDRRRVRLDPAGELEGARIAVSASQYRDASFRSVWDRLRTAELVPTPAFTPKFASILRGECVAALHLPVDRRNTYIWDYAAAAFLLAEAGGTFVSWTGEDLVATRPQIHVGGWIAASNPRLPAILRHALAPALDGLGRAIIAGPEPEP